MNDAESRTRTHDRSLPYWRFVVCTAQYSSVFWFGSHLLSAPAISIEPWYLGLHTSVALLRMSKETIARDRTEEDRFLRRDWERFWVEHQPFLLSRGYRLRPRYDPDWIPSWTKSKKYPTLCEDSIYNRVSHQSTAISTIPYFMHLVCQCSRCCSNRRR